MQAANVEARLYILNFVRDFFTVSDITLKFFFNFSSKYELNIDHLNSIIWDLKKFHGTKKGKVVESLSKTMCYIANINRRSKRILKYKLLSRNRVNLFNKRFFNLTQIFTEISCK